MEDQGSIRHLVVGMVLVMALCRIWRLLLMTWTGGTLAFSAKMATRLPSKFTCQLLLPSEYGIAGFKLIGLASAITATTTNAMKTSTCYSTRGVVKTPSTWTMNHPERNTCLMSKERSGVALGVNQRVANGFTDSLMMWCCLLVCTCWNEVVLSIQNAVIRFVFAELFRQW